MTAPPRAAVTIEGLTREHRLRKGAVRTALDDVSLRIDAGQWCALLGPNGAGKSTLLRIIATLDQPTSGEAALFGEALTGAGAGAIAALRRRLGVVFQTPGLDPILTVRENLLNQAALFGIRGREAGERAERHAEACGVADRLDERVARLSGGLARRADVARALLTEPELLLLDEPTTGLDLEARAAFLNVLERARAERDLTIVMTTHLMEEAERADRVAMLDRGRIVADGAPEALRHELGGRLVRCSRDGRAALEGADLDVRNAGDRIVGAGDSDQIRRAIAELVERGIAFEVGPPTLADVYLARTGRALAHGDKPKLEEAIR